jgi:hypothetical protein
MEQTPHSTLPAAPHGNGDANAITGLIGRPTLRCFLEPIAELGEHRGDSIQFYTLSRLLMFPHWPAMHTASPSMRSCR